MPGTARARETSEPSADRWLTKPEAAAALGVSLRQIERLAETGRLTRRDLPPIPGDKYHRTGYSGADVDRLRGEREAGVRVSAPSHALSLAPLSEGQLLLSRGNAHVQEALVGALAAIAERVAPDRVKAWLTLDEAAAYSGLPVPELVRRVRSRELYAIGRGRGTWRIQRAALDGWGDKLHTLPAKRRR